MLKAIKKFFGSAPATTNWSRRRRPEYQSNAENAQRLAEAFETLAEEAKRLGITVTELRRRKATQSTNERK